MQNYEALSVERFKIAPQMQEYDLIRQHLMPYVSQSNPPNFSGNCIHTDSLGYRISNWRNQQIDSASWLSIQKTKKILLLGGSVAFGWGASSDQKTLASLLAQEMDQPTQSLGIMAANSTHEYISGIPFYLQADTVVSITGFNTITCGFLAPQSHFDVYSAQYPFNTRLWEDMRSYDILMLRYLISNDVNPGDFFKSRSQSAGFRQTRASRWKERLLNRFKKKERNEKFRSPDEALEYSLKTVCRDIHNQHHAAGKNRYLCVIQPQVHQTRKVLTSEENRLIELAESLMQPDIFKYIYETLPLYWTQYTTGIIEYCLKNEIFCMNLDTDVPYEGWCFVDSTHFTDHGNHMTAQAIAKKLKGMNS